MTCSYLYYTTTSINLHTAHMPRGRHRHKPNYTVSSYV